MADLSPAQRAFISSDAPFPAFVGGFGSGKTTAGMLRAIKLKVACRTADVAYYLPTYPLIQDIAFQRFPELCERNGWAFKLNQQDAVMSFPGAGRILFRNMEQPHRIVGYEVAHSVVDELDILPTEKASAAWNKIIARNRQKCGMPNSVGVVTTPEGFRFVYERWQKNAQPGYVLYRAKTMDNAAHLPPDYIPNLQATYPANLLMAYLDGEFCNLTSGSVYHEFDRALNGSSEAIQPSEPLHIGCDFNVGNVHAIVNVLRSGEPHAVEELTGILDTPALIALIKSRYVGHSIMVYPDASGNARKTNNASQSDIALLRAAGFNVFVNPANPAVRDRVLAMNQMIHAKVRDDLGDGQYHEKSRRRLKVNADRCPVLVEALEKQAYDKNGEPDKSAGFDHAVDAQGYFIAYRFPIQSRTITPIRIGGI